MMSRFMILILIRCLTLSAADLVWEYSKAEAGSEKGHLAKGSLSAPITEQTNQKEEGRELAFGVIVSAVL